MRRTVLSAAVLALALTSCGGPEGDERTEPGTPTTAASAPTASTTPSATPTTSPTPSPTPTAPAGPEWRRAIPFWARAIATDAEGAIYVTGSVEYGRAEPWGRPQAMTLERSDPDGRQVWIRRWKSRDEWYLNATGFDVAVSPDADVVYVAGEIMDASGENRAIAVWAYSPEGRLLWFRQSTGSAFGPAAAASDAGVVVGGYGWLGAYDRDGTELWARDFEEPAGDHCDTVAGLAIAGGGDIYAVGLLDLTPSCNDTEGLVLEDADILIQKRSASGDLRWSRVFTDPETDVDRALAVDVTKHGVFVTGENDGRAWLARLSPTGRIRWTDRWGNVDRRAFGLDLAVSPWGALYVIASGPPYDDPATLTLRRYTTAGKLEWSWRRRLPGEAEAVALATAAGDALYVMASDVPERCLMWRLPA